MESLSPPGFSLVPALYRGREGWTRPLKGKDVAFSRQLFSFPYTYIPLMDILIIHSLTYSNLIMTTPHQPKQIKSHWYYVFWSLATIAVVLGQVYVATSYRALANALTLTLT